MADTELVIRSVSAVLKEHNLVPEIRSAKDLVDRQIIISGYKEAEGDFGTFFIVQCADPLTGEVFKAVLGGMVVREKLELVARVHEFPVMATITWSGKYYDIE